MNNAPVNRKKVSPRYDLPDLRGKLRCRKRIARGKTGSTGQAGELGDLIKTTFGLKGFNK
jgi:hypothetical protein